MTGTSGRAIHLLRYDRATFVLRARQHLRQRWLYARAAQKALLRRPLSAPSNGAEKNDVLAVIGEHVSLLILERRSAFVRCGVLAIDVPALLSAFWRYAPQRFLKLDGRACPKNRVAALTKGFRIHRIDVAAAADTEPFIQIDVFDPTDAGSFINRTGMDRTTGVLYGDVFPAPTGIRDLTRCMPEIVRRVNGLKIDIVYTWVDNMDPVWMLAFDSVERPPAGADSVSESRFYSNDELRFSLRSAHAHLPWANKIHIISNCQPPKWLDPEHPRLRWVPHEAVLSADCLPTFNSHAIEAALHLLPGLAENFLYFNDDFLAFRPLLPSDFINDNGTLIANLERQAVVNSQVDRSAPDYLNAARNSASLLFDRYGYYPTRLHRHSPYSLSRSLLESLEAEFEDAFQRTRRAQFRSVTDVNVASFFAHHYGYLKRATVYGSYPTTLIKSNDCFSLLKIRALTQRRRRRPKVVCINEGGIPEPRSQWRREVARFMAAKFPISGPWERDAGSEDRDE